jgi:hypothetical protein
MWFIIRTIFCVGVVFSMAPGGEVMEAAGNLPAALTTAVAPALRDVVDGALSTCKNDPKLCLDTAQRFAGARSGDPAVSSKAGALDGVRLVADTLTLADRAARWRGAAKATHASTHARAPARPAI